MHVLMIVSNPVTYDPRVRSEAESLVKHGHHVTVLGWDRESQFVLEEKKNGVEITRLRNTAYMNMLPFDLLRLKPWWRMAYGNALKLHRRDPFHVVHCHDLDTLPTGVWLKRKLGVPLIYDAHEIWGYMVSRSLPSFLANYYLREERRLVKQVDSVITVNEPLKDYFEQITSVPVTIVMNAKPVMSTTYVAPRNDAFTVVYIGTLNDSRFVKDLVDAVHGLTNVRLVIGGIGKPTYVASLAEKCRAAPNANFLGKVPQEDVLPSTSKADAVLSMFDPKDKLTRIGLPNKVFEAMACGRPTLVSKGTYLAEFTEKHGVGLAVEYSVKGVREGIRILRDDQRLCETLGRIALEKAVKRFNWEAEEGRLLAVYDGTRVENMHGQASGKG